MERKNRFQWKDASGNVRGSLRFGQDDNGLPVLYVDVAGDPDLCGLLPHRALFDLVTELCFVQLEARGEPIGMRQTLRRIARPDPHQEVFGRLHLLQTKHLEKDLVLSWPVQRPFRPIDLLFFGATHQTVLRSLRIGGCEQLPRPVVVLEQLNGPNYLIEDLIAQLVQPPTSDTFDHLEVRGELQPVTNANPPVHLKTVSPGQFLQMTIGGFVEHVVIVGLSVW